MSSWRSGMNASGEGSRQPAAKRSTNSAAVVGGASVVAAAVSVIHTVCMTCQASLARTRLAAHRRVEAPSGEFGLLGVLEPAELSGSPGQTRTRQRPRLV